VLWHTLPSRRAAIVGAALCVQLLGVLIHGVMQGKAAAAEKHAGPAASGVTPHFAA
jgi:hypothetical protein